MGFHNNPSFPHSIASLHSVEARNKNLLFDSSWMSCFPMMNGINKKIHCYEIKLERKIHGRKMRKTPYAKKWKKYLDSILLCVENSFICVWWDYAKLKTSRTAETFLCYSIVSRLEKRWLKQTRMQNIWSKENE